MNIIEYIALPLLPPRVEITLNLCCRRLQKAAAVSAKAPGEEGEEAEGKLRGEGVNGCQSF